MKRHRLLTLALLLLIPGLADAQYQQRERAWTVQLAAGYSAPLGIVDELFEGGASIVGGATFHPRTIPVIAAWVEANYNGYDVNRAALESIGVSNGDLRMWSVTGGMSLEYRGKVGVYVPLGVGWYRRQFDLINPAENETLIACNPWWYFCLPVQGVISQNLVGSRTFSSVGYNVGIGLTFRVRKDDAIYVEAKYHRIPMDVEAIELVPIVVGYQW